MDIEYEMRARVKSVYSIWNKMQNKGIDFSEVYDLFAVRIIFEIIPGMDEKKTMLGHLFGHYRYI